MQKITLLYIPTSAKAEAKKLAKHMLKKKLIACANIFPIESLYLWKSKIQSDKEVVLLVKTAQDKVPKLKKEIEKLHSYDVPAIIEIPAEANEKYAKWMKSEIA